MGHFYFLISLGVIVLCAMTLSLRKSLKSRLRLPYRAETMLFTPVQQVFKSVLEQAVGKDYHVYGRVRVADIIGLQPRLSRQEQNRALDRLGDHCFDFLICTHDSTIACAVNLASPSRRRRPPAKDRFDRICAAARLPYVRLRESDSVLEIEEQILAAMQTGKVAGGEDDFADAATILQQLSAAIHDKEDRGRVQTAHARIHIHRPELMPTLRREPSISSYQVVDAEPDIWIDQKNQGHLMDAP